MLNKMRSTFAVFIVLISNMLFAQTSKIIVVASDGSGDFVTIQQAVNAIDSLEVSKFKINIKAGIYEEKIIIPKSKSNITFIGEDKSNTIITFDDYSGKIDPILNVKYGTSTSYTVLVLGNNIEMRNLTIQNSWCEKGQAVALHVEGNQFSMINSNILGCQDTLFTTGKSSNQFYLNCYIEGTTDFIFGPATVVFKDCTIKSKKNSFITAASTPENQEFGYVFFNCKLIADSNITKVFLGRPWRPYAKTVFIKSSLGSHIVPEGWDPWIDTRFPDKDKTAYYAEYKNEGRGAKLFSRVSWSHQLTKAEYKKYTLKNIFKTCKNWPVLDKN